MSNQLYTISEAADSLEISEALVDKFINLGLIQTVKDGRLIKITSYGIRRLNRIIDMYESSFSHELIEEELNY